MRGVAAASTGTQRRGGIRLAGILTLGVLWTLAPAVLAQHGGHAGGFSGGGHISGGFSGGHAGSFGGGFSGRSFGGGFSGFSGRSSSFAGRNYSSAPRMTWRQPARGFVPANRYASRNPYLSGYRGNYNAARQGWADHRRDGDRGRGRYRAPYRGVGFYGGYPYVNSWELTPWELGYPDFLGYGNDIGYDQGDGQGSADVQPDGQDAGAGPEDDYRPAYGEPAPAFPRTVAAAQPPLNSEPQLTLIFSDGHQQAIRNYALTSDSVIVLDDAASGRQQRIPLSQLNLQATEQAAQQAGLDFTPPA